MKKALKEVRKYIIKNVGKKCKDRCRSCFVCIAHEALETLEEIDEIKS